MQLHEYCYQKTLLEYYLCSHVVNHPIFRIQILHHTQLEVGHIDNFKLINPSWSFVGVSLVFKFILAKADTEILHKIQSPFRLCCCKVIIIPNRIFLIPRNNWTFRIINVHRKICLSKANPKFWTHGIFRTNVRCAPIPFLKLKHVHSPFPNSKYTWIPTPQSKVLLFLRILYLMHKMFSDLLFTRKQFADHSFHKSQLGKRNLLLCGRVEEGSFGTNKIVLCAVTFVNIVNR